MGTRSDTVVSFQSAVFFMGLFFVFVCITAPWSQQTASSPQAFDSTATVTDSLMPPGDEKPQKIQIVQRNFNYREAVWTSVGMMLFVLMILTSCSNWNPD
ncbi:MAG: hypothetical protein JW795_02725 [Chitinivibrionales bacterium]|nr:hypothetical protein [Chitinivibrionales bacterium]